MNFFALSRILWQEPAAKVEIFRSAFAINGRLEREDVDDGLCKRDPKKDLLQGPSGNKSVVCLEGSGRPLNNKYPRR